jgi:hypothetical protein
MFSGSGYFDGLDVPSTRLILASSMATSAPTLALFNTSAMLDSSDAPPVVSATCFSTKGVMAAPLTPFSDAAFSAPF